MADFAASLHDVSFLSGPMHPAPALVHLGTLVVTADTTPPTVTVVSPAVGTTISPTDALVIDVEDETSLQTSILMAKYLSAILPSPSEVIWDGSSFLYPFTGSTRSSISGGWRYSITRTNGWSSSPTIKIYAVDSEGNEA